MKDVLVDLTLAWKAGDHVEWSRLWWAMTAEQRAAWDEVHGG